MDYNRTFCELETRTGYARLYNLKKRMTTKSKDSNATVQR